MLDQFQLLHEPAMLIPVFRRHQVAEEARLNDCFAFLDGIAEHSLARATLPDSHTDVGGQACATECMTAVTQHLATEGAAGAKRRPHGSTTLGHDGQRLKADRARVFVLVRDRAAAAAAAVAAMLPPSTVTLADPCHCLVLLSKARLFMLEVGIYKNGVQ